MTTTISPEAAGRRETARTTDGRFGYQQHRESGVSLHVPASARHDDVAQAYFAAGGYEDGEHFGVTGIEREEHGTWTVHFADRRDSSHETGEEYTATWSPGECYRQDDTTSAGDYYAQHSNPGRNAPHAFGTDVLGVAAGAEARFFERAEAMVHSHNGDFESDTRDAALVRAQHQATGLAFNDYVGDYESTLSDAWRNQDGTWSLQYGTDAQDQSYEGVPDEEIERVSVTYVIDAQEGLVSTRVTGEAGTEVLPRTDPYDGELLQRSSGIEDAHQWVTDTESRWQVTRPGLAAEYHRQAGQAQAHADELGASADEVLSTVDERGRYRQDPSNAHALLERSAEAAAEAAAEARVLRRRRDGLA